MEEPAPGKPHPFLLAIVVEGGIGLIAVGAGSLLGTPPAEQLRWTPQAGLVGLLATIPLVCFAWLLMRVRLRPFEAMLRLLDEVVVPLFRQCPIWQLGVISLFAGLGEEMLFRGVLQQALTPSIGEPWDATIGLLAASVLFGLLHWLTTAYAVLATLIGVYLGGLWMLTGNLLIPAVVHALYDFWALVYLVRLRRSGAGP